MNTAFRVTHRVAQSLNILCETRARRPLSLREYMHEEVSQLVRANFAALIHMPLPLYSRPPAIYRIRGQRIETLRGDICGDLAQFGLGSGTA